MALFLRAIGTEKLKISWKMRVKIAQLQRALARASSGRGVVDETARRPALCHLTDETRIGMPYASTSHAGIISVLSASISGPKEF